LSRVGKLLEGDVNGDGSGELVVVERTPDGTVLVRFAALAQVTSDK